MLQLVEAGFFLRKGLFQLFYANVGFRQLPPLFLESVALDSFSFVADTNCAFRGLEGRDGFFEGANALQQLVIQLGDMQ